MTHPDFRPGKRPRFVPSGSPRRRIPLIRIALLLALGLFVYARFDDFWPRLRDAIGSIAPWRNAFGQPAAPAGAPALAWSPDSSRVALECPRGLTGACCEALGRADPDLCGEARAALEKARWRRAADPGGGPLRLEARAVVSDLGGWGFDLSGLRGRDGRGVYTFRRAARGRAWCDAGRGCLGEALPRPPLAQGRRQEGTAAGAALWIAASPRVLAMLPGRIVAVDSLPGGARVRVYHGRELYAAYEPLRPAPGVRPGALVKSGSHLGDAPRGAAGHALTVRVRQAGRNLDPAAFWGAPAAPDERLHAGIP